MKHTAEFIRRAAFVDANALLKDERGVEYKNPSQVQYYGLFKDAKAINEALKHVEYQEATSRLTIVGEEDDVNAVRLAWETAPRTYTTTLNERVSNTGRFHTNEELAAILNNLHFSYQGGGCA